METIHYLMRYHRLIELVHRFMLVVLHTHIGLQVTYNTRAYRKQQHNQQQQQQQQQKPTMLPIGDPAVLWRHTVCLNAIVHRLKYTLTVAVCARVPRKAAASACFNSYDGSREFVSADVQEDCEYDLQLLSRHVHVSVYCLSECTSCFWRGYFIS